MSVSACLIYSGTLFQSFTACTMNLCFPQNQNETFILIRTGSLEEKRFQVYKQAVGKIALKFYAIRNPHFEQQRARRIGRRLNSQRWKDAISTIRIVFSYLYGNHTERCHLLYKPIMSRMPMLGYFF